MSPAMASAAPTFAPVTRRTVAEEVRAVLLTSIRDGTLAPGAQLPAERSLCEQFGVARTSLREAMQSLISTGVVERRGNRTHVVEHLPEIDLAGDARKEHVRQLFETRRLIEIPMVELVCERASPQARQELLDLATQFRPDLDVREFRRLDRSFHGALAAACGNPLLQEVHTKVLDALFSSVEFDTLLYADENQSEVAVIMARSGDEHRAIATAIHGGDPVAVVSAVEEHLEDVESRMIHRLV